VADLAWAGGDLADASLELGEIAAGGYLMVGDVARAAPLARESLALARQMGAPAIIAAGLLAVGGTVASTDTEQARACLHESRELSTALGYQSALNQVWAATIPLLVGDRTATLELGGRAIHNLGWSGDRLRTAIVFHVIAGALAAIRPEAAAIIQGAAEAHVVQSPMHAMASGSLISGALGDSRAAELRARGADMDWDQALAYTLTQITEALTELQFESGPTEQEPAHTAST
jgi:hypothetical protein